MPAVNTKRMNFGGKPQVFDPGSQSWMPEEEAIAKGIISKPGESPMDAPKLDSNPMAQSLEAGMSLAKQRGVPAAAAPPQDQEEALSKKINRRLGVGDPKSVF